MHGWPSIWRRRNRVSRRIVYSLLTNCSDMSVFGSYFGDLIFSGLWTNLLVRWRNGPRLVTNVWIDWFHTFITRVNTDNIVMWETLSNDADLDCFKTLTSREILKIQNPLRGGTLCVFESHTFVSISWMCKKQTSVSRSSTEAEIISLDESSRMDGIPALTLWNLVIEVFHSVPNRTDGPKREPRWNTSATVKSNMHDSIPIKHTVPTSSNSWRDAKPFFWSAEPQRRAAKHLGHAWKIGEKRFLLIQMNLHQLLILKNWTNGVHRSKSRDIHPQWRRNSGSRKGRCT